MIMVKGLVCVEPALPCRFCGLPSFLAEADDERQLHPLHPCCRFWIGERGKTVCPACISFNVRRKQTPIPARAGGRPPLLPSGYMQEVRPISAPAPDFSDDDDALLALLQRLRSADGLWVDALVLTDLVGDARLLAELTQAGCVHRRSLSSGDQYRIVG